MSNMDVSDEQVRISYETSRDFRVVFADAAALTLFRDGLTTTLQITFTRMEPVVTGETFQGRMAGTSVQQTGPSEIQTAFHRTKEVAVQMRPDHTLALAKALFENLRHMDEAQRQRYNISSSELP